MSGSRQVESGRRSLPQKWSRFCRVHERHQLQHAHRPSRKVLQQAVWRTRSECKCRKAGQGHKQSHECQKAGNAGGPVWLPACRTAAGEVRLSVDAARVGSIRATSSCPSKPHWRRGSETELWKAHWLAVAHGLEESRSSALEGLFELL